MKILYFSQFYYPENVAASFRATDNSQIWSNKNEITIYTTYPNFPKGEIFEGYNNELLKEEYLNKVKVLRSKICCFKNSSKIKKIIGASSYFIFSIINFIFNRKKIGKDYDIVLGTTGTLFNALLAYIYSILIKKTFVLEIRDITFIQFKAVYGNNKSILFIILKKLELYLCKKANKIIVVTNGFKEELIEEGIEKEKIEVIPNGVIIGKAKEKEYLEEKDISSEKKKSIFSYIGNLGKSQNLLGIINLFEKLNIPNSQLMFIGEGAEKDLLNEIEKEKSYIKVISGVEKEKLDKYYDDTLISIVSLKNNDNFKNTIPSKIFESMSRKKTILYLGPEGEAANIIRKADCGIINTDKEFSDEFIMEFKKIILDKEEMKKKSNNGYEYVKENYNRENLAQEYIDILAKTILE